MCCFFFFSVTTCSYLKDSSPPRKGLHAGFIVCVGDSAIYVHVLVLWVTHKICVAALCDIISCIKLTSVIVYCRCSLEAVGRACIS